MVNNGLSPTRNRSACLVQKPQKVPALWGFAFFKLLCLCRLSKRPLLLFKHQLEHSYHRLRHGAVTGKPPKECSRIAPASLDGFLVRNVQIPKQDSEAVAIHQWLLANRNCVADLIE